MKRTLTALVAVAASVAWADEGMWTYNNFPSEKVKQAYGFAPTQDWLDHVRLSSARLAGGCSASFVSPDGLVMTNHHCAHGCIEQLSTPKKDFVAAGFYAKTDKDEVKCPTMEVNQLVQITDVTDRIGAATKGLVEQKYNDALKGEMSKIEKECSGDDAKLRCDVVTLYRGGKYNLYKYKRFQDVRLVFAPEFPIAFFGGDPDNFNFPRYDLDVSFVRVYEDGKPAHMDHYLKWNPNGVKDGDVTFVSGHPGRTSRLMTVAELAYQRDIALPNRLMMMSELRGALTEYQKRGKEQKRHSTDLLFGIENSIKALKGRVETLRDADFFAKKVQAEKELRAKVDADPAKKAAYGGAWDAVAKAQKQLRDIQKQLNFIENGNGFFSDKFRLARLLVRYAEETQKPNEKRLRELADSNLPAVKAQLLSSAPIYDEFDTMTLGWSLTKLRENLGTDDPFVKKVLGKEAPEELAAKLVKGSKLNDLKVRKALLDGGAKAIDASTDPMIQLARLIDADGRAIRKTFEDQVDSVIKKNNELVAKAQFEAYGTNTYPDATFTLRLSYGQVKGYPENGKTIAPVTNMAGTFDRATGKDPYKLPESWIASKGKLKGETNMNFATNNDIIGGNSGSPVVNKNGEVVGLVFDGNIQSLGGEYGFDETVNRTVAVDTAALHEALGTIYGADRVVKELTKGGTANVAGPK